MPASAAPHPELPGTTRYVAVIGDVVQSRALSPEARAQLQEDLSDFLVILNQGYADVIQSGFVITSGDEFQGLLKDASIVPDIIWATGARFEPARVRYGVGYGALYTALQPIAIGMDGPAFHRAREAITRAREEGWRSGVFAGFGEWQDQVLNGLARLLEGQTERLTARQLAVANLLRDGLEQAQIAQELGVTRQAISEHARAIGWEALAQGEAALTLALARLPACP
jgi:hypothetical protein